ncbi:MAG: F0F1 ATP synthase subunit A [Proteobacteria bacterium]|nr:F0F1 ATP synthase subunit A [Pseudomonadota bacterium]
MTVYSPLENALGIPATAQAAVLACVLLFATSWAVRRQLAAAGGGLVPDEGVTLRNVVELVIDGLSKLARENMGEDWRRWFPLVGTIFVFILFSNLLGLVPGVGGATSSVNTTAAWALIAVGVSEYVGIRKHGARYVQHFIGPSFDIKGYHVPLMAPLFIPLELVGHVARVATLAIRLLANMFADHTIVVVMASLVPLLVPSLFMGLGAVVAVLQAFVFSLLTMVYIGLALEDAH